MNKVLCLVKYIEQDCTEQEIWMDLKEDFHKKYKKVIIPLYDLLHNDIENGQKSFHYHVDNRYIDSVFLERVKYIDDFLQYFDRNSFQRIQMPLKKGEFLEYNYLQKVKEIESFPTHVNGTRHSKLRCNHIKNNKCPHKGYDLSNETSVNGIITCPLHSLQFNAKTKKIINKT